MKPPRRLSLSFDQPLGSRFERDSVRGYYIDMSVKATAPRWPPPGFDPSEPHLYVVPAQFGLGAFERFLASGEEQWLEAALGTARYLAGVQEREGPRAGGLVHTRPYPHTFPLDPPWLSGMAQGEGASLLVRLYLETGEERLAEAARLALRPLAIPVAEGGVAAALDGRELPEEYPTDPPSFVLNGAIFALWGLYDVGTGLGDAEVSGAFEEGVDALAASIDRWDTGYWSRYDLYPHPMVNVASPAYHTLHIDQLEAMGRIAPRPQLQAALERFRRYATSAPARARAFAAKAAFRLRVPRTGAP